MDTEINKVHDSPPKNTSSGFSFNIFRTIHSWYLPTSRTLAEDSEKNLLSMANINLSYDGTETVVKNETQSRPDIPDARVMNVSVDKENFIRTLYMKNKNEMTEKNLVITHGFGNGLGFYFKNYEELGNKSKSNVYSIDWLGMGLSSRPDFKINKKHSPEEQVAFAEEFFVESLEKWREEMKIDKMVLLGHSFGGYMSSLYALKYPERIEKLVLESPVGIPETPESMRDLVDHGKFPEKRPKEKDSLPKSTQDSSVDKNQGRVIDRDEEIVERLRNVPFQYKLLGKAAYKLWDSGQSPQGLLRFFGRYGQTLTGKYISRLAGLNEEEKKALSDYMFHVSAQKGSSEYAMGVILKPFSFARVPLKNRIINLTVPTSFIYGEKDWMDQSAGKEISDSLKVPSEYHIIPNAGHNMHLDNPEGFNKVLIEIINNNHQE
ncbi:hypothetical protein BB559_005482 [Furculomyces boomerangus]|uniref:AB hydrolase-1 domain-containing protein n=2 Tax=Harpellales TaxID=61421 RepID=A0A2T9Y8J6_9FUNG|nr:hypothetical protein BB559_005482 [Furculomyces boomerangus]PWA00089.1 hypothetical protein BB558_003940 [Smittium angustum]PWA02555.1 hypothetical protein BB558_001318 [Smittium angustum]